MVRRHGLQCRMEEIVWSGSQHISTATMISDCSTKSMKPDFMLHVLKENCTESIDKHSQSDRALSWLVQQPGLKTTFFLYSRMSPVEQVECQFDLMSLSCECPGWHVHAVAVWILGPLSVSHYLNTVGCWRFRTKFTKVKEKSYSKGRDKGIYENFHPRKKSQ